MSMQYPSTPSVDTPPPSLTLCVFLVCIRHCDLPVAQILPTHALDRCIARLKTVKAHKAKTLAVPCSNTTAACKKTAQQQHL